jgi:hypothetical protein
MKKKKTKKRATHTTKIVDIGNTRADLDIKYFVRHYIPIVYVDKFGNATTAKGVRL